MRRYEVISGIAVVIGLVKESVRGVVSPDMGRLAKEKEIVAWPEHAIASILHQDGQWAEIIRDIRGIEEGQHSRFVAVKVDAAAGFGLIQEPLGYQVLVTDAVDAVLAHAYFEAGA